MALINPHTLTEEGRAARRRNGGRARGAATPEGKERSRAANLKHGLYSKEKEQALLALGEDPADLADLVAGCYQQWDPTNRQECDLVEQMAQAQWCKRRAARREESLQARHLEKVAADRREKALQLRYHNQDQTCWLSLAYSYVLRPDFYATPGCIARFHKAFGGEMEPQREEILDLLQRLRQPVTLPPAVPLPPGAGSDANWQEFLAMDSQADGEDVPRPDTPIAEGEERSELRAELGYLVKQEQEEIDRVWEPFFARYLAPMTLADRDEAVMTIEGKLERLRREEESCLRQLWRLTNLLLKIRKEKQEREDRSQEPEGGKQESGDRSREGEGGRQKAEGGKQRPGNQGQRVEAARQEAEATDREAEAGSQEPDHAGFPLRNIKNEGATGDMVENKGGLKSTGSEKAQSDAPNAAPAAPQKPAQAAAGGSMRA